MRVSVSENHEQKLINFKNLADLSRLPGVYFKMNREARISLRTFFIQKKKNRKKEHIKYNHNSGLPAKILLKAMRIA